MHMSLERVKWEAIGCWLLGVPHNLLVQYIILWRAHLLSGNLSTLYQAVQQSLEIHSKNTPRRLEAVEEPFPVGLVDAIESVQSLLLRCPIIKASHMD